MLCLLATNYSQAKVESWKQLETQRVSSDKSIVWKQISPGNAGFANLLRYHPTIPQKVVMCPDMWNAYISSDNGTSWDGITDYDGKGAFYHIRDLYFSPQNPDFGVAICSSEVWTTNDLGRNWERVLNCPWYKKNPDGTEAQSWMRKVASLAIDPNDTNTWYVGGGQNVRGQNWLSCYATITEKQPRGAENPEQGKLWRTTNAGESWELINEGLPEKIQVGRIIVNPKNSKQVFISSNYGIFKSENGGNKWRNISKKQLDNEIIMDMDFYYNAKSGKFILYAIDQTQFHPAGKSTKCSGGIFASSDEGKSWQRVSGNLALDINRLTGGVPENYYLYISKWFGITVKEAKARYPELPKQALQTYNMIAADPSREDALYIGFADPQVGKSIQPGRLWTTTDGGKKWISTARLYEETWEKDKAYWEERGNPWHANMVVGHESPHMRFGKNYALRSMRGLAVGVDGSVMIISDHSTMLSRDNGKSWQQMDERYTPSGAIVGHGNSNLPALSIAQDKRLKTTLLASGEHRVWIPAYDDTKGDIALRFVKEAQETVSCIAFDPYDPKVAYSTSSRQGNKQHIFRTEDSGESWAQHGVATPATNKWLDDFYTNGLLIDPINPQYMYHGITIIQNKEKASQGGFFRSVDGGKTFEQSNKGLPTISRINDIKFDPRDKSYSSLFAAAQFADWEPPKATGGGLFHSADRGESWTKVNLPSEIKSVQFIEIDNSSRIYITTGYRGAGNGVWCSDDFGGSWTQVFNYAGAECIYVSPFDRDMLVVSVKFLALNPGIYFSRDRGLTWSKCNDNIVIPHQVEDVKFDMFNAGELWLATKGCGFYKGKIEGGEYAQVVEITNPAIKINGRNPATFMARIVNPRYRGAKIVWKSENDTIASVNEYGVVTPHSRGNVKIWATTEDGRFSDYGVVTVMK